MKRCIYYACCNMEQIHNIKWAGEMEKNYCHLFRVQLICNHSFLHLPAPKVPLGYYLIKIRQQYTLQESNNSRTALPESMLTIIISSTTVNMLDVSVVNSQPGDEINRLFFSRDSNFKQNSGPPTYFSFLL